MVHLLAIEQAQQGPGVQATQRACQWQCTCVYCSEVWHLQSAVIDHGPKAWCGGGGVCVGAHRCGARQLHGQPAVLLIMELLKQLHGQPVVCYAAPWTTS